MYDQHQALVCDEDIVDQADCCLQTLIKAYLSAQISVRVLDQETNLTAKDTLFKYKEDLEKIKFWTEYVLENISCSSSTDKP